MHNDYPNLFAEMVWGTVRLRFEARDGLPDERLIANVNVVPFVGERCVILQFQGGEWEVPGGTLEPGESYLEVVRRELMEEAGARLVGAFEPFGAWRCHSLEAQAWRPHLPYPDFYRVVGHAQVELAGAPRNPAGGEQVSLVDIVSVEEAARRFLECGRADLAELYRLADFMRKELMNAK